MHYANSRYIENLSEEFSIKRKTTEKTEKKTFHLHKQLEIVFALSDNLKCKFESGIIKIPKNSMILLSPMNLHYIFSEEGSGACDRYVLYFSSNYISPLSTPEINLLECFLKNHKDQAAVLSVPPEQMESFLTLLHKMEHYHCSVPMESDTAPAIETYGKELHIKFLFGQFLLLTNQLYFQQYGSQNAPSYHSHSQLVYEICEYIRSHYDSDLDTECIAKQFLMGKTQLYHIFKKIIGMTVSEYLTDYRIERAKDLLINTIHSVEFISQSVGYGNISSFSRTFKHKAGYSPLQYRQKHTLVDL